MNNIYSNPQQHSPERPVIGPVQRRLSVTDAAELNIDRAFQNHLQDPDRRSFQPLSQAGKAVAEAALAQTPKIRPVEVTRTILDGPDYPVFKTPADQAVAFMHLDGLQPAEQQELNHAAQPTDQMERLREARRLINEVTDEHYPKAA